MLFSLPLCVEVSRGRKRGSTSHLQLFLYLSCPYHMCGDQASLGPQESPMSVSVGCVTGESQFVRMGCTEIFVSGFLFLQR